MDEYYCRELRGLWYVFHRESGVSTRYHSKRGKYHDLPIWKLDVFSNWIEFHSNGDRMKVKKKTEATPSLIGKIKVASTPKEFVEDMMYYGNAWYEAPNTITVTAASDIITSNCFKVACKQIKDSLAHNGEQKEKEKGNTMHFHNDDQLQSTQRNALSLRLSTLLSEKTNDMRTAFGLEDDKSPTSAKDFIKRIQDGKFVLPKHLSDDADENDYFDLCEAAYGIRWRDPDAKEDYKGYKEASKEMNKAYQDAVLDAAVLDLPEALEVVKKFQAATFH